ncbi:hypothetical protein [Pseudonocardia sp. GCM10023141]|uniref:hypothetical protein n=1 Tax=Pseudonocardia sp. GCM10023141 TaxID=3252653 RepID=UPI00361E22FA
MQALLYGVAVLACPVGMGVMMWMMMRGQRTGGGNAGGDAGGAQAGDPSAQVAALRAEIDQLKSDRSAQRAPGGQ